MEHPNSEDIGEADQETMSISTPTRNKPIMLTTQEVSELLDRLVPLPQPLSPEVKRASATYKRMKAARL